MLIWYFGFTIFILVNVSHTYLQFWIYVFNCIVIRLSWHVFCYLISKNLYSLQNAQSFIFQLICMQLCKCLNCFLKAYNKQLNQYCLNFFFFTKKKFLKIVRVWIESGWHVKKMSQVTSQLVFASGQKNQVQVGSG